MNLRGRGEGEVIIEVVEMAGRMVVEAGVGVGVGMVGGVDEEEVGTRTGVLRMEGVMVMLVVMGVGVQKREEGVMTEEVGLGLPAGVGVNVRNDHPCGTEEVGMGDG